MVHKNGAHVDGNELCEYVLKFLQCLLIAWYLALFIMISSILFYIWTIPHKTSYLWVGYNWSIVKSILTIGDKISPPSLEKSPCLFLPSSYRTWKSRTLVESILGICQRELQTVYQILSDFSPMGIASYRDRTKSIFFLPPSCPPEQIILETKMQR